MKLRQQIKKLKRSKPKVKEQKQLLLLDGALKKLSDLGIAVIDNDKYIYSPLFTITTKSIITSSIGKVQQLKLANEAGRKLIPEILAIALNKPSRREIENMIVAYVCLKIYIDKQQLQVDKKIIPDLAYAVWYLNDHEPTVQEVEEWNLQKK